MKNLSLVFVLLLAACSSNGSTRANVSCDEVCAHLTTVCGFADPGCASGCASLDSNARACAAEASTCEGIIACGESTDSDAGVADMNVTNDSGTDTDSGTPTCDGTKYCSDPNTVSYCEGGITRSTSCAGHDCAEGRCGLCNSADDCRGVQYRCRCADGTERTGTVDATCNDTMGSMRWCSHPSIDSNVCGAQGFDPDFGYLATGCISNIDP